MKWIAAVTAALMITIGAGGAYMLSQKKAESRCSQWVRTAGQSIEQGYHAAGIETLTLYFSTEACRGQDETPALNLLSKARPHVPLPDRAHLAQSLMLARLGLKLQADNRDHLQLATAALNAGDWSQAYHHGIRAKGARASLIMLAAATALNDKEAVAASIDRFQKQEASPFQLAFAYQILAAKGIENSVISPLAVGIDPLYRRFAAYVATPDQAPMNDVDILGLVPQLNDEDIAIASMLLIAKNQKTAARHLLDQPTRAMPPALHARLARLLWQQDPAALAADRFLLRAVDGSMPGEVYLMICLTEWQASGQCQYRFDEMEHKKRYGIFAASRWMKLLQAMSQGKKGTVSAIDAMNDMPELLAGVPAALPLKSVLLSLAAEDRLAIRYDRSAARMGYQYDFAVVRKAQSLNASCAKDDQDCLAAYIAADEQDLNRWREAIDKGFTPTLAQATRLSELSPQEALLWRRALALSLVKSGGEADHARALSIVREGIALAPEDALLQMIAATSYSRFGDQSAAFTALVAAVKADPDYAAFAMRLALGFHAELPGANPADLVHQWVALSRLELKQRGAASETDRLLLERLSILAAYGQETSNDGLSKACYEAILKIDGKSHMALNNLAYQLFQEGGDLRRATAMARKAVALAPDVTAYQDTLRDLEGASRKKARGEA